MALLKFILYAIIIYYVFIFFSRFIFSFFLKRWIKKNNQNIHGNYNSESYKEHKSGDTVVQYKKDDKKTSELEGEYIDFEDLNEDNNE